MTEDEESHDDTTLADVGSNSPCYEWSRGPPTPRSRKMAFRSKELVERLLVLPASKQDSEVRSFFPLPLQIVRNSEAAPDRHRRGNS